MVINDEDYKKGYGPIPVRAGCITGPCACSGHCKKIIGYIIETFFEKEI